MRELRADFCPFDNGDPWSVSPTDWTYFYARYEDPDDELVSIAVIVRYDVEYGEAATEVHLHLDDCSLEYTAYGKLTRSRDYMRAARKAVAQFNEMFAETVGVTIVPRFRKVVRR